MRKLILACLLLTAIACENPAAPESITATFGGVNTNPAPGTVLRHGNGFTVSVLLNWQNNYKHPDQNPLFVTVEYYRSREMSGSLYSQSVELSKASGDNWVNLVQNVEDILSNGHTSQRFYEYFKGEPISATVHLTSHGAPGCIAPCGWSPIAQKDVFLGLRVE